MTTKTEGQHTGEFLVSEANGTRSREAGTLVTRSDLYEDGTLLMASGNNLVALAADTDTEGGVDPDKVVGILYGNYDASAGNVKCAYIARDAEVKDALLTYPQESTEGGEKAASVAGLKALGIITR